MDFGMNNNLTQANNQNYNNTVPKENVDLHSKKDSSVVIENKPRANEQKSNIADRSTLLKVGVTDNKQADSNNTLKIEEKELNKVVKEANRSLTASGSPRSFSYSVDKETNIVTIKVIDKETEEIIKEIPPEEQVEAIKKMWRLNGILVDESM